MVCVLCFQEAILFLQRLATLARSGYKGPVQQKWEATFLEMIHQLCTSSSLPQVRRHLLTSHAALPHLPAPAPKFCPEQRAERAALQQGLDSSWHVLT